MYGVEKSRPASVVRPDIDEGTDIERSSSVHVAAGPTWELKSSCERILMGLSTVFSIILLTKRKLLKMRVSVSDVLQR